jgi:hypothetical protein
VNIGDPREPGIPRAVGRARRRVLWGLVVFVAAFLLGGVAVSVGIAFAVAGIDRSLGHMGARDHLKPIPIDASACPYVVAMHNAANDFQNATPALEFVIDEPGNPLPWTQSRAALTHAADVLDVTIAAGVPHLPPQVQTYLTRVRVNIGKGRRQAALATTRTQFLTSVEPFIDSGKSEFGFAGDLIGHACSVDLGADSSVYN